MRSELHVLIERGLQVAEDPVPVAGHGGCNIRISSVGRRHSVCKTASALVKGVKKALVSLFTREPIQDIVDWKARLLFRPY